MIIGIGTDLVDVRRIEHLLSMHKEKFLARFFSREEVEEGLKRKDPKRRFSFYASRFAAKEACSKALGTGLRGTLSFRDMVVSNDAYGKPILELRDKTLEHLNFLVSSKGASCVPQVDLSLTDEYPFAMAFVVISVGI